MFILETALLMPVLLAMLRLPSLRSRKQEAVLQQSML
jgi:hypothetical protein